MRWLCGSFVKMQKYTVVCLYDDMYKLTLSHWWHPSHLRGAIKCLYASNIVLVQLKVRSGQEKLENWLSSQYFFTYILHSWETWSPRAHLNAPDPSYVRSRGQPPWEYVLINMIDLKSKNRFWNMFSPGWDWFPCRIPESSSLHHQSECHLI